MARERSQTYRLHGIVVRKRPIGESDLVVTFLAEDGQKAEAVAKGARKPRATLAPRTEVLTEVDALCARGRSLDIVKEARVVASNQALRDDFDKAACAAVVAEAVGAVIHEDVPVAHLFDMTRAAFSLMGQASALDGLAVCAAHLLKTLAYVGLRPSFDTCVACGKHLDLADAAGYVAVSVADGGAVCDGCRAHADTQPIEASTLTWANFLLYAPFSDIADAHVSKESSYQVLALAHAWYRMHVGTTVKSLGYLFSVGFADHPGA